MRFQRFKIRPAKIPRTVRRVRNAERAVRKELDSVSLFPELARFKSAQERLDRLDVAQIAYWQGLRDLAARQWRKFRRRLYGLPEADRLKFLAFWNSRTMLPAMACNASDALTNFFDREDWRREDIAEIQGGRA